MALAGGPLIFHQSMSTGLRWFVAAAGLFCFWPTYDLLIRPGVPVLQLGMVPMWIIALGAMALGLLLLAASALGISRTVIFDSKAAEMLELGAGSFGLRWRRRYAFSDLGKPAVMRIEDSEGPPSYRVAIPCAGKQQPVEVETYADEVAARETVARVAALLAQRAD